MFRNLLLIFFIGVTLPLVVLILVIIWIAKRRFLRSVDREIAPILQNARRVGYLNGDVILEDDLRGLPQPVQRWLRYCGVVGRPCVFFARVRGSGRFRQTPDRPWMRARVVQYTAIDPPTRVWIATMRMPLNLPVVVRDIFRSGHGSMLIRPLGLFTLEDASGPELDQGSAYVFLNDMMFIPQIAMEDYVHWEAIDDTHARATFTDGELEISAEFEFSPEGEIRNMVAQRYGKFGDDYRLERWSTPVIEYQEMRGYRIPKRANAVWHLEDGDFTYFEAVLDEVEYNNPDYFD